MAWGFQRMLTDAERAAALKDLDETHAAFLQTLEDFPASHFSVCPGEGRWSAAQTIEHVIFVEGRALGRIRAALNEPFDPARRSDREGRDEELWAGVRSRENRVQAPAALHPAGDKTREELIQSFQAARRTTLQFAADTAASLRNHFAPHPVFGNLDCYQWLRMISAHCERHRRQIEETRLSHPVGPLVKRRRIANPPLYRLKEIPC